VVRVIVGYTGGKSQNPTYQKMADHTEALFIEFNPKLISYWQILGEWQHYNGNDPRWATKQRGIPRQYRSAIFWITLQQQDEALQFTQMDLVEMSNTFYRAEAYHQNHLAQLDLGIISTKQRKILPKKQLTTTRNNTKP
jgi:peptide-methionine (S)-S-oxide reductase